MSAVPNYTAENCRFAYQLLWSFNLFWRAAPIADDWLGPLSKALEADGIRVLQHRFPQFQLSQFLLSTLPTVSPRLIAQRVKGRLQFLIRSHDQHAFQRNDSLRSIGSRAFRRRVREPQQTSGGDRVLRFLTGAARMATIHCQPCDTDRRESLRVVERSAHHAGA